MTTDLSPSAPALRIGLFTHSTNPRGGVVHCLELAEALAVLGHAVVVHAPDEHGRGFFRPARRACHALIPAAPAAGPLPDLVRRRVAESVAYLGARGDEFDVYHAHDGISGNVLAELTSRGVIPGFVRTVHHLDEFADPWLRAAQDRSVTAASCRLCVSRAWRDGLRDRYGIDAAVVGNGVDAGRFSPGPGAQDALLRGRLMSGRFRAPVFLAVGGVERRKNTVAALRAFLQVRRSLPRALLLVAGGASLLDHSAYRREFDQLLAAAGPGAAEAVVVTGALPDEQMAAAYRLSDALVFPSLTEGFGLAVLEAMACGTPAIVSRIPPFTEYLREEDALLVGPHDIPAIAAAMRRAVAPSERARLGAAGLAVSGRFPWSAVADAHQRAYRAFVTAARCGAGGPPVPSSETLAAPVEPSHAETSQVESSQGEPHYAGDAIPGAVAG